MDLLILILNLRKKINNKKYFSKEFSQDSLLFCSKKTSSEYNKLSLSKILKLRLLHKGL